jgi:hypothetical protein
MAENLRFITRENLMSYSSIPDVAALKDVVEDEIHCMGGTVLNSFVHGRKLFMRSIQPDVLEVQPGDKLQRGVAVRASEDEIWVHPYVFRQVCTNGSISAQTIQSRHIESAEFGSGADTAEAVRAAIRECCAPEVFAAGIAEMRTARDVRADNDITLMSSVLTHVAALGDTRIVELVLSRFLNGADKSRFGLMNAVTSVARDAAKPEQRWRLEELGGGIPCGRVPKALGGTGLRSPAAARARSGLVAIG